MVVHTFNPSNWAGESGGFLNYRLIPDTQCETLTQKRKKKRFVSNFVKIFFIKMYHVDVQQTDSEEIRCVFMGVLPA